MKITFPVIQSVLSPKALAEDVESRFTIGEIAECTFYSGGFNHTYILKTSLNRVYYLRAYRQPWRTLEDIKYELDVLNHLNRQGFPAAQPIADKECNYHWSIFAPEGVRYAALFSEAPGPEISYEKKPKKTAYQYGQAVASMHNALENFSSTHKRFHKDIYHLIDKPLRYIEPFLSHRPDDWAYLQSFARKTRQGILDMPAGSLEMGFCHGDLQGYHANVDSDGTFTFFDFDCGGYGFRAYDLAVFLWCCRLDDAVDSRWEPYIRGYQETRTINSLDLKAVPFFVCARYIWHMGVHTQNAPDWGHGWLKDEYFDKRLKLLRRVETDYLTK